MEKTIKEWLSGLPEGIREKALLNHENENREVFTRGFHRDFNSLPDALENAFDWESSPEGMNYWDRIHDNKFEGDFKDELTALRKERDELTDIARQALDQRDLERKENQEARELLKEAYKEFTFHNWQNSTTCISINTFLSK